VRRALPAARAAHHRAAAGHDEYRLVAEDLADGAQHQRLRAASNGEDEHEQRHADEAAEHHDDRSQRIAAHRARGLLQ
jgi:hypothetical protein